tara:strand:- start:2297 stop:5179 length:2883 start_codon:yes stop_codon:yes gene_type:complete
MKNKILLLLSLCLLILPMAIADLSQYYRINLESVNGEISAKLISVIPSYQNISSTGQYAARTVSFNDDILEVTFFDFERVFFYDGLDEQTGETIGGRIIPNSSTINLYLPYFVNAKEIQIYDRELEELLTIDVSSFSEKQLILTEESDIDPSEIIEKPKEFSKDKPKEKNKIIWWILIILLILIILIILKKRKSKTIIASVILILLIPSAIAVCPGDANCPTPLPDGFNYQTSSYDDVPDWRNFDFKQVPAKRMNDLPIDQIQNINFDELKPDQINALNEQRRAKVQAHQLKDNLQKVHNLALFPKSSQAIFQKYGIGVDLSDTTHSDKDNRVYIHRDTLKTDFGSKDYIPLDELSIHARVIVVDNGKLKLEGERNLPIGKYFVDYDNLEETTFPSGEEANIKGLLVVDKERIFVDKLFSVTVNNYKISLRNVETNSGQAPHQLELFFDGEKHQGNYLSMGKDSINFALSKESNTQLQLIRSKQQESDLIIKIAAASGSITARDNLIPEMNVQMAKEGEIDIDNSGRKIRIKNGKVFDIGAAFIKAYEKGSSLDQIDNEIGVVKGAASKDLIESKSVPFTLKVQGEDGESWLGPSSENHKLIFDKEHNFIVVPNSYSADKYECKKCTLDFSKSRVVFNYAKGKIKQMGIKVQGSDAKNPAVLAQLLFHLERMPPAALESITTVDVTADPAQGVPFFGVSGASAHANPFTNILYLSQKSYGGSTPTHEALHILTFKIEKEEEQAQRAWKHALLMIPDSYWTPTGARKLSDLTVDLEKGVFRNKKTGIEARIHQRDLRVLRSAKIETQNTFKQRWLASAPDVSEHVKGSQIFDRNFRWEDDSHDPKFGHMNPYGAQRDVLDAWGWYEGPATFFEHFAVGDYKRYQDLTNPNSKWYKSRLNTKIFTGGEDVYLTQEMMEQWAIIYRDRLALGLEYGFVTTDDYCKVSSEQACQKARFVDSPKP